MADGVGYEIDVVGAGGQLGGGGPTPGGGEGGYMKMSKSSQFTLFGKASCAETI